MQELCLYTTNDGSAGLYSPEIDDIYHSACGALTEAYEKFILPAELNYFFTQKDEIKILDICYGIGYNTKSFINEYINFCYNYTIDSNNTNYIYKLYTNNIFPKIFIHAVDNDKILPLISPFIKSNIKRRKDEEFFNNKIKKLISDKIIPKYRIKNEVNLFLFSKLKNLIKNDVENLLINKKYKNYFDQFMIDLYPFNRNRGYKCNLIHKIIAFLHNIYYKYISWRNKNNLNSIIFNNITFYLSTQDARQAIFNDQNTYNIIFLDAFTPSKCPCLWTIDFFKLLYNHLDNDGIILTYSTSALVRNAFIEAGFFVGKTFSKSQNKFSGTIATKNKSFIKNELSEFDLGLLKTKAGIFYRDENLSLTNEDILKNHKIDVENSKLMSTTKYKKFKI